FGNNGPGAHQAVAADHGVIQHDGLHADQGALVDGTAVQHGLVPHGDARPDGHRAAFVHVQHAGFLDVGAFMHHYRSVVAADRHMRPDTCAGVQGDVADDMGAIGDIDAGVDDGRVVVELVNRHATVSGSGQACMPACASSRWRSTLRWILPVVVMGSSAMNSISFGYSYGASRSRTCSCTACLIWSGSRSAYSAVSTTYALTSAPRSASGLGTTATLAT